MQGSPCQSAGGIRQQPPRGTKGTGLHLSFSDRPCCLTDRELDGEVQPRLRAGLQLRRHRACVACVEHTRAQAGLGLVILLPQPPW